MLYWHVFDKTSSKFYGILFVFVNFAGFRGYPELHSSAATENNLSEALNLAVWHVRSNDTRNKSRTHVDGSSSFILSNVANSN